eukprot:82804-Prorocentrum_minimum.AAC.1
MDPRPGGLQPRPRGSRAQILEFGNQLEDPTVGGVVGGGYALAVSELRKVSPRVRQDRGSIGRVVEGPLIDSPIEHTPHVLETVLVFDVIHQACLNHLPP